MGVEEGGGVGEGVGRGGRERKRRRKGGKVKNEGWGGVW